MPTLRGTVSFDDEFEGPAATRHLVECLHAKRARFVHVHQNRIQFGGGFFRMVSSWNVLLQFYTGDIVVDAPAREVRYRVSITQLLLICTVLIVFMGVFLFAVDGGKMIWVLPVMWLWIVGGNLVFGLVGFRSFLRKSVLAAADPFAAAVSERVAKKN